ncbi:MAG: Single-stranded DNA-binding protein [Alphaproteobacteria bacterium MarineAlpha6_Bin4]|nr:MAG: Single-stranded DNA-binding protein [Alphaproteobacteria bacterium MarineAlpha6_Bin3]PPR37636.1 MAG: Single-stranded DNA-binding protein [Alphaproteobacteria bacterium MarineAlpha6_Bin4]|tara:strand:+ start:11777 stop:12271 length:495 start_codon:yes stop_codon:yes gene_type:complete
MAGSVNKVILLGNLGQDPDVRTMQNGKKVCSFSIATSDSWKDKETGEKKEKTEWHRIVVFNEGLVGVVENYIKKGTKIYLEGSLQTRKWTDDKGTEKYTTEVVIQGYGGRIDIVSAKGDNQELSEKQTGIESNNSSKEEITSEDNKAKKVDDSSDNLNEEDIPF